MEILDGGSCPNCGGTLGLIDANCGCRCVKAPRITTPADKGTVRLEVEEVETEDDILLRAKVQEETCSHRVTFYLDGGAWVSTDTDEPEKTRYLIECGLAAYYRRWWQRRTKLTLSLEGKPQVFIPIAKIQCYKIEPIEA